MGSIGWQGKIKKASASAPSANEPGKYLILVHTAQLKMIKAHISGRMFSNGISDVATTLVNSEKNRLKKLMMMMKLIIIIIIIIIIIMNKSQETTIFRWCQKLTSATKLRTEK